MDPNQSREKGKRQGKKHEWVSSTQVQHPVDATEEPLYFQTLPKLPVFWTQQGKHDFYTVLMSGQEQMVCELLNEIEPEDLMYHIRSMLTSLLSSKEESDSFEEGVLEVAEHLNPSTRLLLFYVCGLVQVTRCFHRSHLTSPYLWDDILVLSKKWVFEPNLAKAFQHIHHDFLHAEESKFKQPAETLSKKPTTSTSTSTRAPLLQTKANGEVDPYQLNVMELIKLFSFFSHALSKQQHAKESMLFKDAHHVNQLKNGFFVELNTEAYQWNEHPQASRASHIDIDMVHLHVNWTVPLENISLATLKEEEEETEPVWEFETSTSSSSSSSSSSILPPRVSSTKESFTFPWNVFEQAMLELEGHGRERLRVPEAFCPEFRTYFEKQRQFHLHGDADHSFHPHSQELVFPSILYPEFDLHVEWARPAHAGAPSHIFLVKRSDHVHFEQIHAPTWSPFHAVQVIRMGQGLLQQKIQTFQKWFQSSPQFDQALKDKLMTASFLYPGSNGTQAAEWRVDSPYHWFDSIKYKQNSTLCQQLTCLYTIHILNSPLLVEDIHSSLSQKEKEDDSSTDSEFRELDQVFLLLDALAFGKIPFSNRVLTLRSSLRRFEKEALFKQKNPESIRARSGLHSYSMSMRKSILVGALLTGVALLAMPAQVSAANVFGWEVQTPEALSNFVGMVSQRASDFTAAVQEKIQDIQEKAPGYVAETLFGPPLLTVDIVNGYLPGTKNASEKLLRTTTLAPRIKELEIQDVTQMIKQHERETGSPPPSLPQDYVEMEKAVNDYRDQILRKVGNQNQAAVLQRFGQVVSKFDGRSNENAALTLLKAQQAVIRFLVKKRLEQALSHLIEKAKKVADKEADVEKVLAEIRMEAKEVFQEFQLTNAEGLQEMEEYTLLSRFRYRYLQALEENEFKMYQVSTNHVKGLSASTQNKLFVKALAELGNIEIVHLPPRFVPSAYPRSNETFSFVAQSIADFNAKVHSQTPAFHGIPMSCLEVIATLHPSINFPLHFLEVYIKYFFGFQGLTEQHLKDIQKEVQRIKGKSMTDFNVHYILKDFLDHEGSVGISLAGYMLSTILSYLSQKNMPLVAVAGKPNSPLLVQENIEIYSSLIKSLCEYIEKEAKQHNNLISFEVYTNSAFRHTLSAEQLQEIRKLKEIKANSLPSLGKDFEGTHIKTLLSFIWLFHPLGKEKKQLLDLEHLKECLYCLRQIQKKVVFPETIIRRLERIS